MDSIFLDNFINEGLLNRQNTEEIKCSEIYKKYHSKNDYMMPSKIAYTTQKSITDPRIVDLVHELYVIRKKFIETKIKPFYSKVDKMIKNGFYGENPSLETECENIYKSFINQTRHINTKFDSIKNNLNMQELDDAYFLKDELFLMILQLAPSEDEDVEGYNYLDFFKDNEDEDNYYSDWYGAYREALDELLYPYLANKIADSIIVVIKKPGLFGFRENEATYYNDTIFQEYSEQSLNEHKNLLYKIGYNNASKAMKRQREGYKTKSDIALGMGTSLNYYINMVPVLKMNVSYAKGDPRVVKLVQQYIKEFKSGWIDLCKFIAECSSKKCTKDSYNKAALDKITKKFEYNSIYSKWESIKDNLSKEDLDTKEVQAICSEWAKLHTPQAFPGMSKNYRMSMADMRKIYDKTVVLSKKGKDNFLAKMFSSIKIKGELA